MSEPGRVLASGRDADILEYGPGKVLRRTRTGRSIEAEARIMQYVAEHGYPVPAIYDVLADGAEIVMERVDGPLMLDSRDSSRRGNCRGLWRPAGRSARPARRGAAARVATSQRSRRRSHRAPRSPSAERHHVGAGAGGDRLGQRDAGRALVRRRAHLRVAHLPGDPRTGVRPRPAATAAAAARPHVRQAVVGSGAPTADRARGRTQVARPSTSRPPRRRRC